MSDFDLVLERLLNDPPFAAALAADPDDALLGYRLDAEESALLRSQVGPDTGGHAAVVESRVTKSSTFGLLSPFAVAGGLSDMIGGVLPGSSGGLTAAGHGSAQAAADLSAWSELGSSDGLGSAAGGGGGGAWSGSGGSELGGSDGFGSAPDGSGLDASDGFGSAPGYTDVGGGSGAWTGAGGIPMNGSVADADPAAMRLGDAPRAGLGEPGEQRLGAAHFAFAAQEREIAPPKGYDNAVDADGDGTWDAHTLCGRADGGVDILVDVNRDGEVDFVGHDVDADRTVDYAEYDSDRDGTFEKRMFDDDGDGWLDRTVHLHP